MQRVPHKIVTGNFVCFSLYYQFKQDEAYPSLSAEHVYDYVERMFSPLTDCHLSKVLACKFYAEKKKSGNEPDN